MCIQEYADMIDAQGVRMQAMHQCVLVSVSMCQSQVPTV